MCLEVAWHAAAPPGFSMAKATAFHKDHPGPP